MKRASVHDMAFIKVICRSFQRTTPFFISLVFISLSLLLGCAGSRANKAKAINMEDMGRSLATKGKPREGLSYLIKASELDPNNPEIKHQIALVYNQIGEYKLALQHFEEALHLKPDYSEAINNMGITYSNLKEWDKALACFQKAASDVLYKTPHYAYHNMGLVYYYKGDYTAAIEKYQKALALSPSYAIIYFDLAASYISLSRFDDAIDCYKKASELMSHSRQADLSLASLYIKINKHQDAMTLLKSIIESDPRSQAAKEATQMLQSLEKK
jgi:type IV pilus assembly protein PilF